MEPDVLASPAAPALSQKEIRRQRFADLCQETTGFGEIEWRTFRDLLIRPRAALEAYLIHGPTGGRCYAKPFGFYLALCGVLMFSLFLVGGLKGIIQQQPPAFLDGWLAASGKSREAFIDDADGWMSLIAIPLMSVFYALLAVPLFKWWSGLDWQRSARATFVYLCAWTVPLLPLGPLPYIKGFEIFGFVAMISLSIIAFLRMGRGLWWESWPGGIAKGVFLAFVLLVAGQIGMIPVIYIGLLGALWGA